MPRSNGLQRTLRPYSGDNLRAARKYYAAAADMSNATDARALYGLVLVDARLKKYESKRGGGGGGGGGMDGVGGDSELSDNSGRVLLPIHSVHSSIHWSIRWSIRWSIHSVHWSIYPQS